MNNTTIPPDDSDSDKKPEGPDGKSYHQTPFKPEMGGYVPPEAYDEAINSAEKERKRLEEGCLEFGRSEMRIRAAREEREKAERAVAKQKAVLDKAVADEVAQARWEKTKAELANKRLKEQRAEASLLSSLASAGMTAAQLHGMVTKLRAVHPSATPEKFLSLRQTLESILTALS